MTALNNERNPYQAVIPVGTQSATIVLPAIYFRKKSRIKALTLIDQVGIAASGSNWIAISLDIVGGENLALGDTKAGAVVDVGLSVPLTAGSNVSDDSSNPEVEIPAGSSVTLTLTATGTVTTTKAVAVLEAYSL